MNINNLVTKEKPTFSLEVFPPKKDGDIENIYSTLDKLAALNPHFISVTYGAGGSTNKKTAQISNYIQTKHNIPAIAHLTCVGASKEQISHILTDFKKLNIKHILALRGDFPKDTTDFPSSSHFNYAKDLIKFIKENGDFSIGGACYPEGHVENPNKNEDIKHIKEKVDAGCDYLTTQFFFDNQCFYDFLEKLYFLDVKVPVIAGIMPITQFSQIKRMCELSGASIPKKLAKILEKYGHDNLAMKEAGIAYATDQIIDLLSNNVDGIHLYTMNKYETSAKILSNIDIIRKVR